MLGFYLYSEFLSCVWGIWLQYSGDWKCDCVGVTCSVCSSEFINYWLSALSVCFYVRVCVCLCLGINFACLWPDVFGWVRYGELDLWQVRKLNNYAVIEREEGVGTCRMDACEDRQRHTERRRKGDDGWRMWDSPWVVVLVLEGGQQETGAKDKRERGSVWQRWRGDFLLCRFFSEGISRTELLGDRQSGG